VLDLMSMYQVSWGDVVIAHDAHPDYVSTATAQRHTAAAWLPIQHHRAHVASVLAERGELRRPVVGVSFDGTGFGDDGSIWGGEIFAGSVVGGFERVAHLRPAMICGGDAAARHPVQAAAGFLDQLDDLPRLRQAPFDFPERFTEVQRMQQRGIRLFRTTSVGRLFDAAAALLGFTHEVTFEGQAAMWLEHLARRGQGADAYACPFDGVELDFRPLLRAVVDDRLHSRDVAEIARAFQRGLATGLCHAVVDAAARAATDVVVLSGGVFQNALLLDDVVAVLDGQLQVWTNHDVPPNDGGISLGQAAIAACAQGARS